MDAEPVRSVIVAELAERLKPAAIAEQVDPRIRELEQLPARPSGMIQEREDPRDCHHERSTLSLWSA